MIQVDNGHFDQSWPDLRIESVIASAAQVWS